MKKPRKILFRLFAAFDVLFKSKFILEAWDSKGNYTKTKFDKSEWK